MTYSWKSQITCTGLCPHSEMTQESPRLSTLVHLYALCKAESEGRIKPAYWSTENVLMMQKRPLGKSWNTQRSMNLRKFIHIHKIIYLLIKNQQLYLKNIHHLKLFKDYKQNQIATKTDTTSTYNLKINLGIIDWLPVSVHYII